MTVNNLDLLFRDILDIDEPSDGGDIGGESRTDDEMDPVGQFLFREEFKIDAPGAKPVPLTISQIGKSLDAVRRAIGGENPFAARLQKLNFPLAKMAASAAEYSGEDSPVASFLKAAAEGSDAGMKAALEDMALRDAPVQ